eukprot:PhM_4_TR17075/c0_g1_i7/m.87194/K14457/MOGAT2, MGAT2; 2-acylglycerol O-acyltransferase 2
MPTLPPPTLACLELIVAETDDDTLGVNPLSYTHAEMYMAFLDRVRDGLTSERERELCALGTTRVRKIMEATKHISRSQNRHDGPTFAPLFVPLHRRLEVLSATIINGTHVTFFPLILAGIAYFSPMFRMFMIGYIAFIVYESYFNKVPPSFRRSSEWFRSLPILRHHANYFPHRTVRRPGATLDASRNYLFISHPHGLNAQGSLITFSGTKSGHLADLFPGIWCRIQSLPYQFVVPFWRELAIMAGASDCRAENILRSFDGPGKSTAIVLGGARESLEATPNSYRVIVKSRKGFVRMALKSGADIVPVFVFGENDLLVNSAANNPKLRAWQDKMYAKYGVPIVMNGGRSWLGYFGGFIPHRGPLSVVIGEPLVVPEKKENPTAEEVDALHDKYCEALETLYKTYQPIYAPGIELELPTHDASPRGGIRLL